MRKTWFAAVLAVVLAGLAGAVPSDSSSSAGSQRYLVVLAGTQGDDGFTGTGTTAAVNAAVAAAGGAVTNDLSSQIGVLVAESSLTGFASALPRLDARRDRRCRLQLAGNQRESPRRRTRIRWRIRSRRRSGTCSRSAPRRHAASRAGRALSTSASSTPASTAGTRVRRRRRREQCGLRPRPQLRDLPPGGTRRRHARPVHGQPVPWDTRGGDRRGAGERPRHRGCGAQRDSRAGQGLRRERLLLRERRRRRHHVCR